MKRVNWAIAIWTFSLAFSNVVNAQEGAASDVRVTVRTETGGMVFHIGEVIPLQVATCLARKSSGSYTIFIGSDAPDGVLGHFHHEIEPAQGWDNPLETYIQSRL